MLKSFKIVVNGIVQGVGFRPFIYNLAISFNLKGTVSNNEQGVIILISGSKKGAHSFFEAISKKAPPVAVIKHISIEEIQKVSFDDFSIVPSSTSSKLNSALTPDFAICENCKNEIKTPSNRRHSYPFTTCVHCGPRWAITKTFPFERNHTSIVNFEMCDECTKEYTAPSNRRFHSQTNSCDDCGIQLTLIDNKNKKINVASENLFKKVASFILEGKIVAVKNTSGYLLCCNALDSIVVQKLRIRKNRPKKPFAVLFPSLEVLQNNFSLRDSELDELTSVQRPITILNSKNYSGKLPLNSIAPDLQQIGVMLPYTGVLELLANELNTPLIATSGNIHGSPIISDEKEAIDKLVHVADYFLNHNLTIEHPQDDSVVKFSNQTNKKVLFRRARGYAPNFLADFKIQKQPVLALGAHLKNTIAFYPNDHIYISEYLGNLDSYDVYERFENTTQSFLKLFNTKPEVVLVDKHPGYQSTQYGKSLATKFSITFEEIQHHKAHFAAILGEHSLFNKRVLGVIFDGTGFGDDGTIWGGEFFEYFQNTINRLNHLSYFDWVLSDKMAKEPRLSLFSLLPNKKNDILFKKFSKEEIATYTSILKNNTVKTSSIGRLFDAVASLLDITDYNSYEGEAPILLENLIDSYSLKNAKNYLENEPFFNPYHIIIQIIADIDVKISKEDIVVNFLYTLAVYIIKFAQENNFQHIAFSGGVFQNTTLLDMLHALAPTKIKLYFHTKLSPNDENISFGQLMYYFHVNS